MHFSSFFAILRVLNRFPEARLQLFSQNQPPSGLWEVYSNPMVPLSLRSVQPLASYVGPTWFRRLCFIYLDWTDMDIVQFIWKYWKQNCYCKIDLEILNFILILQNLPCNIEIISAIVGIIWNYWSHYDIAKFIWKYWYPYWYCRKPLIILKLVLMF